MDFRAIATSPCDNTGPAGSLPPERDDRQTVVVVGGGFSGTSAAAHLLRSRFGSTGRVVIINRSGAMARGVAYGTNSEQHILNVPAGRMSALEDDPDGFVRFLHERGVTAGSGSFVGRHYYGAYLEALLVQASERAPAGALQQLNTEVVRIVPSADGTFARVWLRDGSGIRADRVVLAIGNYPPEDPAVNGRECFSSSRYVRDPWGPNALTNVDAEQPILLVGTGLTMVDVALQLQTQEVSGRIIAVSRHGLLPQPHRRSGPGPDVDLNLTDLENGPSRIRAYMRAVRRYVRDATARGLDWRDVIGALRPLTSTLWQSLSLAERARFLRHVRPFWEIHRHRMAPDLAEAFTRLRESGRVTIMAGRLLAIREYPDRLHVRLRERGAIETRDLDFGTIVNCSGPSGNTHRLCDVLFESLQSRGLVVPDALGLGIKVAADGLVIGRDGSASRVLYYVGPFLRGRDWEATAVPELRRAARLVVEHLLEHLPATQTPMAARPVTVPTR
jgi:uncharacterized NAD(P)/FAD-binding protein YdhS